LLGFRAWDIPLAELVRSEGGILLLEGERDAVSPEIFRGNFMRGMNPDLPGVDVVAVIVFKLFSVAGVVGNVTVMTAGDEIGGYPLSIAVGEGLGLGGSDRASTKSSSSSSSSSEEIPPVSWKSDRGPPWRERIVPTP